MSASLLNTASLGALERVGQGGAGQGRVGQGGAGHGGVVGGKRAVGNTTGNPPRGAVGMVTTASEMGRDLFLKKTLQKSFVSVQCEKVRRGGGGEGEGVCGMCRVCSHIS